MTQIPDVAWVSSLLSVPPWFLHTVKKNGAECTDRQKEGRVEVCGQAKLPGQEMCRFRRPCKFVLFYPEGTEKVVGYNYAAWRPLNYPRSGQNTQSES